MPPIPECARRSALRAGRRTAACAALALALAVALPGCGAGMSGTWTAGDAGQLEFRSDGTVYMTAFGETFACRYEVDGDHVIVRGPNGSQVMTKDGDRLQGVLGMTFVRR